VNADLNIEVLFTPAEFEALKNRDLSQVTCVVFDVLRATSSMVMALTNGAEAIIPCVSIEDALAARRSDPHILLGGERQGVRIRTESASGVDFDLGNSPREYTTERVQGRSIAVTTTNGTRALRACAAAQRVLVGALLNLAASADAILSAHTRHLIVICSGTNEEAGYEDTFAAGALCSLLAEKTAAVRLSDSAMMAIDVYESCRTNASRVFERSSNARRLLSMPELRDDVGFSFRRDVSKVAAGLKFGVVRRLNLGRD
jgi:2-phosphosulfolactate phosphatase